MPDQRKFNVLFLCTGNSCRSQMAEGWARALLSDICIAYSAGTMAKGLDPMAVEVMQEAGVDITRQRSQTIDELPKIAFDLVMTVCDNAREACPVMPGVAIQLHHSFDDPPHLAAGLADAQRVQVYRRVRDEIRDVVAALPTYFERITVEQP
jgi:arsenate reductase (thioredoxin)